MKAYAYSNYGDIKAASVIEVPIPEAIKETIRIKVHASSFNPIDFKRRQGAMKAIAPEKKWPVILGYDASGVVDQVGEGVTKFKVGDEVYTRIGSEIGDGTCAEYVVVHASKVAFKPKNASFDEAAAFPLAAITALQMLRKANIKPGDKVFVNAGAGGVGHYAIQLAKAFGASHVATTASAPKHALLKSLGADETIDYKTQNITKIFADRPFDIALDNLGESVALTQIVKEGGHIVSIVQGYGSATFTDAGLPSPGFIVGTFLYFARWSLESAVSAARVNFDALLLRPNAEDLEELTKLVEGGKVKSVVDGNVFSGIDKAPEAMALLESGRVTGKVVVHIA